MGHSAEGGLVRWAQDIVVVGKLSDNINGKVKHEGVPVFYVPYALLDNSSI